MSPVFYFYTGCITGWRCDFPGHRRRSVHQIAWTFNLPVRGKCKPHLIRIDRGLQINEGVVYLGCTCSKLASRFNKHVATQLPWPADLHDQSSTAVPWQRQPACQAPASQPTVKQFQINVNLCPPARCTRCCGCILPNFKDRNAGLPVDRTFLRAAQVAAPSLPGRLAHTPSRRSPCWPVRSVPGLPPSRPV